MALTLSQVKDHISVNNVDCRLIKSKIVWRPENSFRFSLIHY